MSWAMLVFKDYFIVCATLAFSFLAFQGLRFSLRRIFKNTRHIALLRSAQLLVVASILIPFSFALIPEKHLPKIDLALIRSPLENDSRGRVQKNTKAHSPYVPPTLSKTDEAESPEILNLIRSFQTDAVSKALLGFVLLGIAGTFFKLGRSLLQLRNTLQSGVVYRQLKHVRIFVTDEIAAPFSTLLGFNAYIALPARPANTMHGDSSRIATPQTERHGLGFID